MSPAIGTLLAILSGLVAVVIVIRLSEILPDRRSTFRRRRVSALVQWRVVWHTLGTTLIALVLMVVGLIVGDFPVPAWDALATAVWDRGGEFDYIVVSLRLPRVAVAALAGICLAASGAIFQALFGNPLVSPDIIGINQGAAVCAVAIIVAGGNASLLPYAAFAGALLTAIVIYLLAWRRGVSGARLVLIGIGINALLAAAVTFMFVRYPLELVATAARWVAGTVYGASWGEVRTLAVGVVILLPVAIVLTPRLRVLQLGDNAAAGLGVRVERDRLALLAVGSALAAVPVAVVGPLGFLALLVPHLARLLAGPLTTGVLLLSAALGAIILLGSDIIAQRLFAPISLPAGIVTAALGGPFFLILLYRYNRAL